MSRVELIAPCHFGLESVLKREIQDLGYEIVQVEDGRITFAGDEDAIARANVFIRTAERIIGSTCLKGLRGYNSNYFGLYQQEW